MSGREPIRSYQRIFRPDRRLHHIEGRALPVPGGVPLRGLGYAGSALFAVLALGTGSPLVDAIVASGAALVGAALGGRDGAALAGGVALGGAWIAAHLLGALDWPIRLVLIPGSVAVVGTQTTPDGRPAHRFAAAWVALRLSPRRRSLGRALPSEDLPRVEGGTVWVSSDQHSPVLRRARIMGEGEMGFSGRVSARRRLLRRDRIVVSGTGRREPEDGMGTAWLAVGAGEIVEVRP